MGEVHLADDLLLRRKVAIKIVHRSALSNPRAEKLLRREAEAAAALDNPFICKVYEVGTVDNKPYIAMELVEGRTLDRTSTQLALAEKIQVLKDAADSLHAAWEAPLPDWDAGL